MNIYVLFYKGMSILAIIGGTASLLGAENWFWVALAIAWIAYGIAVYKLISSIEGLMRAVQEYNESVERNTYGE